MISKKIKFSIFSIIILFLSFQAYTDTMDIVTYKMVDVDITKFNFVYIESYGALDGDFAEDYNTVKEYLSRYGIAPSKYAVLFLDTQIESISDSRKYKKNPPETMTEEYLISRYGKPTLKIKRKILVGFFIPPQVAVKNSALINIIPIEKVKVKAFQTIDRLQDGEKDRYEKWERVYDRITMLNFISLGNLRNKYIGAIEMYDEMNGVYTFIALPGNKPNFIKDNNIEY